MTSKDQQRTQKIKCDVQRTTHSEFLQSSEKINWAVIQKLSINSVSQFFHLRPSSDKIQFPHSAKY